MRIRAGAIATIFLALLNTSCKPDNPAAVAGDIIRTFESSCSTSGPWKSAALAQTQALVGIFQRLKEVDQCKDMGSVIENMHAAAKAIHDSYNNQDYLNYLQTKEELQQLTFTLSNTTDPQLQDQLRADAQIS